MFNCVSSQAAKIHTNHYVTSVPVREEFPSQFSKV